MSQFVRDIPDEPAGQMTFEMANLRPSTTKLPFVVWVSQKAGARHDVRVMVAASPQVGQSRMGVFAVRPFAHIAGPRLSPKDEASLEAWINKNRAAVIDFWDGDIEYTEDLMSVLQPV